MKHAYTTSLNPDIAGGGRCGGVATMPSIGVAMSISFRRERSRIKHRAIGETSAYMPTLRLIIYRKCQLKGLLGIGWMDGWMDGTSRNAPHEADQKASS